MLVNNEDYRYMSPIQTKTKMLKLNRLAGIENIPTKRIRNKGIAVKSEREYRAFVKKRCGKITVAPSVKTDFFKI